MKPKSATRGKKEGAPPRVRMRRQAPERDGPLRSRSIFDPVAGVGQAAGSGRTSAAGSPRPVEERVAQVVNTAYRVCEEQLRLGREAAARQHEHSARQREHSAPQHEHSVSQQAPSYDRSDPYDDLRRRSGQVWGSMYHSMYDLMNLCMEVVTPFGADGSSRSATEDFDRAVRPAERLVVTLQISSNLPVRATVEFQADAALHDCLLNKLRPMDGETTIPFAGAGSIQVEADGRVKLLLTVPDGQQPGTYWQELWDDPHQNPVGAVTIAVYSSRTAP